MKPCCNYIALIHIILNYIYKLYIFCQKSLGNICVGLFWVLYCFTDLCVYMSNITQYLYQHYSRWHPIILFFFKIILIIEDILPFYINIRIILFVTTKRFLWFFIAKVSNMFFFNTHSASETRHVVFPHQAVVFLLEIDWCPTL